jgi:mannose-6-phosphate isomerase-like protein (cupin superfamily)
MSDAATVVEHVDGDTVSVRRLFDDARGCEKFAQRILSFSPGRSQPRLEAGADETLYVLDGAATLTVGGAAHPVRPGTAAYVGQGTTWSIEAERGVDVLSVLVFDPLPGGTHAVVDLSAEERRSATADRQFSIGVDPAVGCRSVTQFVGFVPPGRAPDHFHRYDEVLYILRGEGVLHIGDSHEPVAAGACIHFSPELVHSLENSGSEPMQVLGVFRPAGSPSEAYYPDGTRATY